MAQQADRLVGEIRATRARLGRRVERLTSLEQTLDEVRKRPVAWIGGGLLAGVLVGRLWGGSLLRMGRQRVESKLRSQVQVGLGSALLAVLGPKLGRIQRGAAGRASKSLPAVPPPV